MIWKERQLWVRKREGERGNNFYLERLHILKPRMAQSVKLCFPGTEHYRIQHLELCLCFPTLSPYAIRQGQVSTALSSPSIHSDHLPCSWRLRWGLRNSLPQARSQLPQRSPPTEAMDPSLVSLKPPHRESTKGETIPNKRVFFSHDSPQCFLLLKVTIIMELKRLLGQPNWLYDFFFFFLVYMIF